MASIESGGFLFYSNFDSGNLSKVEWVTRNESAVVSVSKNGKEVPDIPDIEFNIWTKPDCMGTEFENGNRTWFYFGVKGYLPCVLMKLNLVDLNRQAKMYSQGMAPVFKIDPGRPHWERIRDRPTYTVDDNIFTLSFKFKTPENIDTIMFFAFTYPYTYTELQSSLMAIDQKFITLSSSSSCDDIYYTRECVCKSLQNRRIDLITISSFYNITSERELRLMHLFPDRQIDRPFKFKDKKIIFISARVHPGETPSSFVFNGLLNFLLNREDPIACMLRRLYVFKMIPFLNPDGVYNGHYRTDTRGVNLNRMYLTPTLTEHPSVYAARALIQYYHCGFDREAIIESFSNETTFTNDNNKVTQRVEGLSLDESKELSSHQSEPWCTKFKRTCEKCDQILTEEEINLLKQKHSNTIMCSSCMQSKKESGLFMYLDMHGHASKKGIFIYGNHFDDVENNVECMLLPKIISLNNHNFHFTACNFTERNMYLKDRRDGMSREGSGRVAVLKITGLVRSYTLECNYNTGRLVNVLPPTIKEGGNRTVHTLPIPPKYTPHIFEEVGRAIGTSILDLTGNNPNSRIPNSEFHSLTGLREWLRVNCMNEMGFSRLTMRQKNLSNPNQNSAKPVRCKSVKVLTVKPRPNLAKNINKKSTTKSVSIPIERKENMGYGSRENTVNSQSSSHSASSSCSRMFNRTATKTKGLTVRGRAKRDNNQRNKARMISQEISTSNRSCQTSETLVSKVKAEREIPPAVKKSSKRIKVTPDNSSDRLKLREICFIKENRTKKLIAKFSSSDLNKTDSHDDDDDLVVAWDPTYSPKILSKTTNSLKYEPSTSKQSPRPNFKSNSFTVKTKRTLGSLRRFTSANLEVAGKIDKLKKRKKIKSKIL